MRKFHIQKISAYNKEQNEEYEKQTKKAKGASSPSSGPVGPNINPSTTYNF